MRTFEDFLQEKHLDTHPEVYKDDLPDAYEDWLQTLEPDEIMEYAEEAIKEGRAKFKEMVERMKKKVPTVKAYKMERKNIDDVLVLTPQEEGYNEALDKLIKDL